jgi:hypothetical protein
LKMELIQGSETSANYNLTPGKYPKEHTQYSNHGESLKSRRSPFFFLERRLTIHTFSILYPTRLIAYYELRFEHFRFNICLMGESNGKLPLRTFPGCSVPESYRSPDWVLVPVQTSPRAEY